MLKRGHKGQIKPWKGASKGGISDVHHYSLTTWRTLINSLYQCCHFSIKDARGSDQGFLCRFVGAWRVVDNEIYFAISPFHFSMLPRSGGKGDGEDAG